LWIPFSFKLSRSSTWVFWGNDTTGFGKNLTEDAYISSVIPQNITDIFSSGSTGDRSYVAGAFDIQYRSYIMAADNMSSTPEGSPVTDEGRKRTQATLKTYQSFILNDAFDIVEGMIVNSKTGGVGFRNHTVPAAGLPTITLFIHLSRYAYRYEVI
jgi:hypothetical protein